VSILYTFAYRLHSVCAKVEKILESVQSCANLFYEIRHVYYRRSWQLQ